MKQLLATLGVAAFLTSTPAFAQSRGSAPFDDFNGVRAEYARLEIADDGGDFDTFSISYVRSF